LPSAAEPAVYRPRRAPEHEVREVRSLAIGLTHWRGADARPWLLLHGWLDAGATFQFLADALPPARTLIAPDWRGFGASAWPADGYWFPDYYADLDVLLDQLSPEAPATLIGHSMGANIAMTYAGIRPGRVRAVVSIEGFGLPRTQPGQAPERYRTWLAELGQTPAFARFPSYESFARYLARRNPRLPADRAAFVARAWAHDVEGDAVTMRADPRHKRVNPVLYRREEAEACWRAIRAPLLFVAGADSEQARRFAEEAARDDMRRAVPHFQLATIADAGHMVHHEQPEALAAAIEEFMSALDGNAPAQR
jgi:pimeloyl-ACP methyl ester carboxylesterase